MCGSIPIIS